MMIRRTILCALCFSAAVSVAGENHGSGGASVRIRETELARRAAEQRCTELQAALDHSQRQASRLRRENAELRVELAATRKALQDIRLQAAELLLDRVPSEKDRLVKEALESLQHMRVAQAEFRRQVQAFQKYLNTVLEVLQPSDSLKREITGRYTALVQAAQRLEDWPSQVAGRGGRKGGPLECRVVAVNDDLQVVVLDSGSDGGIRTGATARVVSGAGRTIAELRVVEVRKRLSAAEPIRGRLRDIAPGASVRFGVRNAR